MKDFVIVTPVLNGYQFLNDCLASVASAFQGMSYRHVIVDGGSTDGSLELVRNAVQPYLLTLEAPGTTMYQAINLGVKEVEAKFVYQLNCDDLVLAHAPRLVADLFSRNPNISVVTGGGVTLDLLSNLVKPKLPLPDLWSLSKIAVNLAVFQPSTFVRREALISVGLFDNKLRYAGDTDLWLKMIAQGHRACIVQDYLSIDRIHDGIARKTKIHLDELKAIRTAYSSARLPILQSARNAVAYSVHNFISLAQVRNSGPCQVVRTSTGRAALAFLWSGWLEMAIDDPVALGVYKIQGRLA